MRALCLLRDSLVYRREAFLAGLESCGAEIVARRPNRIGRDDVLIIWNRYGGNHELANDYERAGAAVIVTENGHLGKTWRPGAWFAMALNHHAGAGEWRYGGPSRWDSWRVPLSPWKYGGVEYIVFAQRGIGEPDLRSPSDWADRTVERLRKAVPHLRVRVRSHPGVKDHQTPLEDDLKQAAGVITWHSGAALASLRLGYPVWYDCPTWIGAKAARPLADLFSSEEPLRDDSLRLNVFRHVAWAMWELDEIRSGEAFRHLLGIEERVTA